MTFIFKFIKSLKTRQQIALLFIILLLLFILGGCGYTQLKFKPLTRTEQVSDTYIEEKKEQRDFLFSPTISNFNTQPYQVYDNYRYRYPYVNYGYRSYNSSNEVYQIYEQNFKINQLIQEFDQYKRTNIMQNVQKTSSPSSVIEKERRKAIWKMRTNPRHRKKVSATRREIEKADASD
jgi:hypothetical protein